MHFGKIKKKFAERRLRWQEGPVNQENTKDENKSKKTLNKAKITMFNLENKNHCKWQRAIVNKIA